MKLRRVSGNSMAPALKDGQLVVIARRKHAMTGEVVMILHDGMEKVKRISRIHGDLLFVEGDNAASSTDSRHFGWISRNVMEGKIIWPRLRNRSYQK